MEERKRDQETGCALPRSDDRKRSTRRQQEGSTMRVLARASVAGLISLALAPAAQAQEPKSAALAKQLAAALDAAKLDSVAAKLPAGSDTYVGALYFPGVQLLVVSARYTVPLLINEKLDKK